ncbi:AraC-like DNA-binding protein [Nocardioides albus]|uniref:AraC-like DNA-binding protein n=1 Tax=Nocardioides albus TaxID=1841 RepID=A0A7W5FB66_9ACTN|nr:AraC-like DNA-binding protein [Nocardioides albus]
MTSAVLSTPWSIRFADQAELTMITLLRGEGVLHLPDGDIRRMRPGETALVRGPAPFLLADRADVVDHPATSFEVACFLCEDDGAYVAPSPHADATTLVVGVYRTVGHWSNRVLDTLPAVLIIEEQPGVCDWMESVACDAANLRPGSQALMDRMLDWALVCTLRTWFERVGTEAPAWYRGLADPVVGPALDAVHRRLTERWTVARMAAEAGVSRALFARRFREVVGRPPLTYVTEQRLEEASDLLVSTELGVAQIAKTVGYADSFGFSAAFKRVRGSSPTAFRRALSSTSRDLNDR